MSYPSGEWSWEEFEEDDQTRTQPLGGSPRSKRRSEEEITGPITVHPSFAADLTPELPRMPDEWMIPTDVIPAAQLPSAERASVPSYPSPKEALFASLRSELSLRLPRARLDSDVCTRKKTIPALRRMVGVPVLQQWQVEPMPGVGSAPPPAITEVTRRARGWSPILLAAMAVCLVAMVVMSIVGLGSKAKDVARAAHTRDVSATGPNGAEINDALVFVDGATVCESVPCTLELAEGVHWITVRASGYDTPPSRSVTAGSDEPGAVHFELTPSADAPTRPAGQAAAPPAEVTPARLALAPEPAAPAPVVPAAATPAVSHAAPSLGGGFVAWGRLNINAIPVSNAVVDGRPVGTTPVMGLKVRPGAHSIVLVAPDGRRAVRSASVAAGASATVAARL